MLANRSIPDCAIMPELAYANVREAAEWLCEAFGFQIRLLIGDHRVQLIFGSGAMIVIEGQSNSDSAHAVMVRVENIDQHCKQAMQHGARLIRPLQDYPYGERQYTVQDPGGHIWTFTQTIADVDPASWGGTLLLQ